MDRTMSARPNSDVNTRAMTGSVVQAFRLRLAACGLRGYVRGTQRQRQCRTARARAHLKQSCDLLWLQMVGMTHGATIAFHVKHDYPEGCAAPGLVPCQGNT